jgi:hypothetical protein
LNVKDAFIQWQLAGFDSSPQGKDFLLVEEFSTQPLGNMRSRLAHWLTADRSRESDKSFHHRCHRSIVFTTMILSRFAQ